MRHKGNLLLVTGVALCLSPVPFWLSLHRHGLHSYTADLSCCPVELIYSEIYWAELPCFVMTGSGGEKECGGKQNSGAHITEQQKQNLWTFQNVPSSAAPPRWKDPRCTAADRKAAIMFRERDGCGQNQAKLSQPSVFIMLKTAFLFFLIPFSHAMCRPNLCWPCTESRRL